MERRVMMTGTIAAWEVSGLTGTTASPLAASTADGNLAATPGLYRDSGLAGTSLSKGFSSTGWLTAAGGVGTGATTSDLYFTVTAKSGYVLSLSEFDLNYRVTTTGPSKLEVDYSTNGGSSYTAIGSGIALSNNSTSVSITPLNLAGISSLQGATTARFRIVGYAAASTSGTFAVYDATTSGPDLVLKGTSALATTVTGLSPTTGPASTSVIITGTGFTGSTAVSFGSVAVSSSNFTVNSDTQITAIAPGGNGTNTVDVTVTSPQGTSPTNSADQFTYTNTVAGAPTVTSVSPASGPYVGGTSVTITGTNFTNTTAVSFGGNAAASFNVVDASHITATTNATTTGLVDVTVTNAVATSATGSGDQFTFTAPTIASFTVTGADSNAGTARTLTASTVAAESGYSITSVGFYLETGTTAGYSADDLALPGTVTQSGGNYSLSYTPTTNSLAAGTYTVYAVANSSSGGMVVASSPLTVVTPQLAFSSSVLFVNEAAGSATLSVTRSGDLGDPLTVNFNTSGGTAVAGTDYTAITNGTLNFAANSATASSNISVLLLNSSSQAGTKTFNVTLFGASVAGTVYPSAANVGITQTARAFTAGDVVIYQAGDGANPLTSNGSTVYLDEYSPAGTLVQSFPLPTYTAGTSTSEGFLTVSGDGSSLIVPGYAANSSSGVTSSSVSRMIDVVGPTGAVDSSTTIPGSEATGNIRGATSDNGTNLWFATSSAGVRYIKKGNTSSTAVYSSESNLRAAEVVNGQLYVSSGAGTAVRVASVGSGLPASAATATELPGVPATLTSPDAYAFVNLSGVGSAPDTLYVADDSTGIIKFALESGTWTNVGSIGPGGAHFTGITASVSSGVANLYITTGGSAATGGGTLWALTDTSGYEGSPSTSIVSSSNVIATAGNDTAFRGVAFAPTAVVGLPGWVTGAATYSASTDTLTVTGAATIVADPAGSAYNDGTVNIVASGASSVLNTSIAAGSAIHIGSLTLSSGASATLAASSQIVLLTSTLSIDPSSKFDIGNSYLDVTGGSLSTITTEIGLASANGHWTGNGITSSSAANDSTHLTAVAAISNTSPAGAALYGTFDHAATTSKNDVLVRYTFIGDGNLDGHVDASDYSLIDNGIQHSLTGWFNGDFNYDNVVNGSDYALIDNVFNTQGPALAAATSQIAASANTHAIFVPALVTDDSFFSDKKVSKSLVDQVQDVITAVK